MSVNNQSTQFIVNIDHYVGQYLHRKQQVVCFAESVHQWGGAAPGQHPAHQRPLHGDAEKQTRWEQITVHPQNHWSNRTSPLDVTLVRYQSLLFCFAERKADEESAKRKRGPAKSVCPFSKASALQHMRDEILGAVQDIEQLLKLGRETHACPYYSTRLAIPPAQVTPCTWVVPILFLSTFS